MSQPNDVRHDWNLKEIQALFDLPFNDLLFQAQTVHRQNHDPNAVSKLMEDQSSNDES